MTDLRKTARTVVTAKLLADAVKPEGDAARADADAAMAALGVERLRVQDDDGQDVGVLTRSPGRPSVQVVDEAAFTAWVQERYPEEIVPAVRPGFRERLLFAVKNSGEPVDPQGELIPGVEVLPGAPYVSCRPTGEAKRRMRDLLSSSGLLALTAAPDPAQPGGGR